MGIRDSLETGQKGRAVDIDDFDMSEIAFDGATAYALEWDKDDTVPLHIVRFSLLRPELREVMATLPKEAKELYPLLFANGGDLYYLSSGAHRLDVYKRQHLPHPFHLIIGFQLLGHAVLLCQLRHDQLHAVSCRFVNLSAILSYVHPAISRCFFTALPRFFVRFFFKMAFTFPPLWYMLLE